jgi:hypothetical protein
MPTSENIDDREPVKKLLMHIQTALPKLEALLGQFTSDWGYEDPVYRFYHQSFKIYGLQGSTKKIVAELQALAPDRSLNQWFLQIVKDGTEKTFEPEHNRRWLEVTRPILEAFFHARYFLEMAVRYGRELEYPPRSLPSGWAALLYLYDLR